jgi:hypothetical protein
MDSHAAPVAAVCKPALAHLQVPGRRADHEVARLINADAVGPMELDPGRTGVGARGRDQVVFQRLHTAVKDQVDAEIDRQCFAIPHQGACRRRRLRSGESSTHRNRQSHKGQCHDTCAFGLLFLLHRREKIELSSESGSQLAIHSASVITAVSKLIAAPTRNALLR